MYILSFFKEKPPSCRVDSARLCQRERKHWGGGRRQQLKTKAPMMQSLPMLTFRGEVDIRREACQRARFDENWHRQWPAAGSVGCLPASAKAYQMTLKISSATVTSEGGRRAVHVWRARECTRWKERAGATRVIAPIVLLMEAQRTGGILLVGVRVCGTAPRSLTHTRKYTFICVCIF